MKIWPPSTVWGSMWGLMNTVATIRVVIATCPAQHRVSVMTYVEHGETMKGFKDTVASFRIAVVTCPGQLGVSAVSQACKK